MMRHVAFAGALLLAVDEGAAEDTAVAECRGSLTIAQIIHERTELAVVAVDPRKTEVFDRRVLIPQPLGVKEQTDRFVQGFRCRFLSV